MTKTATLRSQIADLYTDLDARLAADDLDAVTKLETRIDALIHENHARTEAAMTALLMLSNDAADAGRENALEMFNGEKLYDLPANCTEVTCCEFWEAALASAQCAIDFT